LAKQKKESQQSLEGYQRAVKKIKPGRGATKKAWRAGTGVGGRRKNTRRKRSTRSRGRKRKKRKKTRRRNQRRRKK